MTTLKLRYKANKGQDPILEIRSDAPRIREDRPLSSSDQQSLADWTERYRKDVSSGTEPDALLEIGRELYAWLNGSSLLLEKFAAEAAEAPWVFEFIADRDPDDASKVLLDAPWELLADATGHWAAQPEREFCPVRRRGDAGIPAEPSPHLLSAVFMAASPESGHGGHPGNRELNYEAEEAAILRATQGTEMELLVEESGVLDYLRDTVKREKPDILQLSCHGAMEPVPHLVLESELGQAAPATADQLNTALRAAAPRLLFLSACETAQTTATNSGAQATLDSLAWSLIGTQFQAVLGWAGKVYDHEATQFAAHLYRRLAEQEDLVTAVAGARLDLLTHDPQNPTAEPAKH